MVVTGITVYFCVPNRPWQRGAHEIANGLLRHYFPKGSDREVRLKAILNEVARQQNSRRRKAINYEAGADRFSNLLFRLVESTADCRHSGRWLPGLREHCRRRRSRTDRASGLPSLCKGRFSLKLKGCNRPSAPFRGCQPTAKSAHCGLSFCL